WDAATDVFGLGAVLCEVLTGCPPYTGVPAWKLHLMAAAGDLADAFARLDRCGTDAELIDCPGWGRGGQAVVRLGGARHGACQRPRAGLAHFPHARTDAVRPVPATVHPPSRLGPACLRPRRVRAGSDVALLVTSTDMPSPVG